MKKLFQLLLLLVIVASYGCGNKLDEKYVIANKKNSIVYEVMSDTDMYVYDIFKPQSKKKYTYKLNNNYLEINTESKTEIYEKLSDGNFSNGDVTLAKFQEYQQYLCDSIEDAKTCNSKCDIEESSKFIFHADKKNEIVYSVAYDIKENFYVYQKMGALKHIDTEEVCSITDSKNWECTYDAYKLKQYMMNGIYSFKYGKTNITGCAKPIN